MLSTLEVAEIIGVKKSTVWNWEHGTEPELKHMPKIIEFLGYAPFECPEDPIGRLRYFKLVKGLSYEWLGQLMDREPEQLMDWLSGRVRPCRKNIQNIKSFLTDSRIIKSLKCPLFRGKINFRGKISA
jgi:transcriptional regulator with XRE-family HTH domain